MTSLALLATALLFGGMVLYSFGFAAFLFTALPAEQAGRLLRRAFPHFYLFVLAVSALSALLLAGIDVLGAGLMGLVALTVIPARQVLMPAINDATDTGQRERFKVLHTLSVALTLGHIAAAAAVLLRFT
ncbi:DUF4149 domain-containing protein [Tropicimonas marinistellae]|uniref:DUF4149 domain-containing protein n=1 Tax=Tropicimonas marinistellae TaxID=1739787 RepID=UPI00082F434A|nr:DUF4149 domain-containing protein [Tropicimonas marinistellae]